LKLLSEDARSAGMARTVLVLAARVLVLLVPIAAAYHCPVQK